MTRAAFAIMLKFSGLIEKFQDLKETVEMEVILTNPEKADD